MTGTLRIPALYACYIVFNVGIASTILISYDLPAAKMGGALVFGNLAFLPLFHAAVGANGTNA